VRAGARRTGAHNAEPGAGARRDRVLVGGLVRRLALRAAGTGRDRGVGGRVGFPGGVVPWLGRRRDGVLPGLRASTGRVGWLISFVALVLVFVVG
jgi:hypothetical protein